MSEFDEYSENLLEQAKRFLELAREKKDNEGKIAFLNASLLLSMSSLEAFINGIIDDFSTSEHFSILEIGFLTEKQIELKNGKFHLTDRLKMSRLTNRIEILQQKFTKNQNFKKENWWSNLCEGLKTRNELVHPKRHKIIQVTEVERSIRAIINCINSLFKAIYKRPLPMAKNDLLSKLKF